jgi:hypothetical protein
LKPVSYALLVLLLLLVWAGLYSLQVRFDATKGRALAGEEFMQLPKAQYLKVASLGYSQLTADLLWLKAVQHIGEKKISPSGYEWIYKALDTVTTLDPKFIPPYEVGGLVLTVLADKVSLSDSLLQKGMENNPEVWQFPFYLGFNQMFYQKDYKKAAQYMSRAASIKGSPYYLPLLASRLYVQAEDPGYALEFLGRMYENTSDEKIKEELMKRMNLIKEYIDREGRVKGGQMKENLGVYRPGQGGK